MAKKKYYLILDTETATLPFANELCKTAKEKQTIAIAKPLVYDIGWCIIDRKGEIIKTENFLVQETFFVPNVFNTAYYKEKRPLYMEMLEQGTIKPSLWDDIMNLLIEDLRYCDIGCAFNACFDFKKAIPFTEKYISYLYSKGYNEWESKQKERCKKMIKNKKEGGSNPDYLKPFFELRHVKYPIVDLWGVACEKLINIDKYRNYCLDNRLLTKSAKYFKTSAETCFQYLMKNYTFIEEHTALSDALIEAQILTKALKKGKVTPELKPFPFQKLGTTTSYVKTKKPKYIPIIKQALADYINKEDGITKAEEGNKYWKKIITEMGNL